MTTTIRRATINDTDEIRFLFRDTVRAVNVRDYAREQIEVWSGSFENIDAWKRNITEQYFLVAETNGSISGFASLTDSGYLDFMYVHKDFQRQGIAKKLLDEIEHRSQEIGVSVIYAHVSITAGPFFEAQGFVKTGQISRTVGRIEFVNVVMVRKVKAKS